MYTVHRLKQTKATNGDYKNRWTCEEMCLLNLARLEWGRSMDLESQAFGMRRLMTSVLSPHFCMALYGALEFTFG